MNIIGIHIFSESKKVFLRRITEVLYSSKRIYVCVTGLHGLVESILSKKTRKAHQKATYTIPDGMPLVFLGKLLGYNLIERMYGPDIFLEINRLCEKNQKCIYLYGANPNTLSILTHTLRHLFPKIRIAGTYSPPINNYGYDSLSQTASKINEANPAVVWVGLSTPKQETWMYTMRPLLRANLLIGVGAAFDFISGVKKQSPTLLRNSGFEWLYRLYREPQRLWRRYLLCGVFYPFIIMESFFERLSSVSRNIRILLFVGMFSSILLTLIPRYTTTKWSNFRAYGAIYGPIEQYKHTFIFGTAESRVYSIDAYSGKIKWETYLNSGAVYEYKLIGRYLVAISGDGLFLLDAGTGNIIWKNTHEHLFDYISIKSRGQMLFVGDKEGTLSMFSIHDGKRLWKRTSKPLENLSSIEIDGELNYFGDYKLTKDIVVFGKKEGVIEGLDLYTGSVKWSVETGSPLTSLSDIHDDTILIGLRDGSVKAISTKFGTIKWSNQGNSSVRCILSDFGLTHSTHSIFSRIIHHFLKYSDLLKYVYPLSSITIFENSDILLLEGKSGKIVWKQNFSHPKLSCPSSWFSQLYSSSTDGTVISFSSSSGKRIWSQKLQAEPSKKPIVVNRKCIFCYEITSLLFSPKIIVMYLSGHVYQFIGESGQIVWKHIFPYGQQSVSLYNSIVLFGGSDGLVSSLSFRTGGYSHKQKIILEKIHVLQKNIGSISIQEFTVTSNDSMYKNPWDEVAITCEFTHSTGRKIAIKGFYYDKNTWKVRFNPPLKGTWSWHLTMSAFDYVVQKSGSIFSDTDTATTFLRNNSINPKRLTIDGKTIFNGIGIGDTILDFNYSGTPLDDWAVGDSTQYIATDSSKFTNYFRSNKYISNDTYLTLYGEKGAKFNLFRISLMNGAIGLWNSFELHSDYSIHNGQVIDSFIESLRENDIHVWLTLFGFGIPFSEKTDMSQKKALRSYVSYIVSRYGSMIDIWELANEYTVPDHLRSLLIAELQAADFEHHPISTSFEQPEAEGIDIISPHWYETEHIDESDIRVKDMVSKYSQYAKPVIFGEQGNRLFNYDESSAARMRIRAWVAFFTHASLIFWNTSSEKNYHSDVYNNANLYIGETERGYIRALQSITKNIPLDAVEKFSMVSPGDIRAYTLTYEKGEIGYYIHSNLNETRFTKHLEQSAHIEWLDPSTGYIVESTDCLSTCEVEGPLFLRDIVIRITYAK